MRLFPSLRRSLKAVAQVAAQAEAWTVRVLQCSHCGSVKVTARRPRRQGACSHRCARKLAIAARADRTGERIPRITRKARRRMEQRDPVRAARRKAKQDRAADGRLRLAQAWAAREAALQRRAHEEQMSKPIPEPLRPYPPISLDDPMQDWARAEAAKCAEKSA